MNETTNKATGETIKYNRIGGTADNPIYFNDPVPTQTQPLNQTPTTAISATTMTQGTQPLVVPKVTPNPVYNELARDVGTRTQSQIDIATQEAEALQRAGGNQADQARQALSSEVQKLFTQRGDLAGSQTALEEQAGIADEQKNLREVNTEIANTNVQLRAEQDRIRNTPMSAGQKAVETGNIQDTFGRRLADLAIRQSAAQGNITAIQQDVERKLKIALAPIDNKLEYFKTFGKDNVDALTSKEKDKLALIQSSLQDQKKKVEELEKAKGEMLVELAKNGGGNSSYIQAIQSAKDISEVYNLGAKSGFVGKLDMLKKQAELSKLNAEAQKAVSEAKIANSQTVSANGDYFNALANASISLPENQRKENTARLNNLLKSGDTQGAKELIIRTAFAGQTGTQRDDTIKRLNAIDSLATIKNELNKAKEISGDTGIVSGSMQNIQQKLGSAGNPELAKINTRITQALQVYRNAITGAAWGTQETDEYKKIFPSISNTNKLNTAVIDSLSDALNANQRVTVGSYIGQGTYDKIFTPQQDTSSTISPTITTGIKKAITIGYKPVEIINNLLSNPEVGDKIVKARENGYTDDQIINYLQSFK